MLRYSADIRSLLYGAICVTLFVLNYQQASVQPVLYGLLLFFSFSSAIMAHNHNHSPMFKSNFLNHAWSHFLSFFYGHPVTVWTPVHNRNHHTYVNKADDWSMTYRLTRKNNLFGVLTYNWVASAVEFRGAMKYFWALRKKDSKAFALVVFEYAVWISIMAVFLIIDWKKALLYLVIPGQLTVFLIHVFNYIQHVDTDFNSQWNHSRNFLGKFSNMLLFNNGYHTQHHRTPMMHWSLLPKAHAKIEHEIDPRLNEVNPAWYCFRTYFLRIRPESLTSFDPPKTTPVQQTAA